MRKMILGLSIMFCIGCFPITKVEVMNKYPILPMPKELQVEAMPKEVYQYMVRDKQTLDYWIKRDKDMKEYIIKLEKTIQMYNVWAENENRILRKEAR